MRATTVGLFFIALIAGAAIAEPVMMGNLRKQQEYLDALTVPNLEGKEEVLSFLKGFAVGADTVLGDPAQCLGDYTNMTADMRSAIVHFSAGFKGLHVSEIAAGLTDFANGLEHIASGLKSCGVEKLAADVTEIVKEIRGGQWVALVKSMVVHIWGHGRDFVELFKDLTTSWKAQDWYTSGKDCGELVALVIDIKVAEMKNEPMIIDASAKDVAFLVKGIAEGMGSSMVDPSACTKDIDVVVADMNAAWADLTHGVKHISVSSIIRALSEFADALNVIASSLHDCGLTELEAQIRSIAAQIKAGNLLKVIAQEACHIFCHSHDLIDNFKAVAKLWQAGEFEDCGKHIGEIIGFLVVIPPSAN